MKIKIKSHAGVALAALMVLQLSPSRLFATALPASYAMPAGTVNTGQPGFTVRPYQTDATGGGTIAWNESQQAGQQGPNVADLSGADANGYFTVPTVVNWSIAGASVDGFPSGDPDPGLPGTGVTPNENFSEQVLTYIEFPAAGTYILGVNSDDGFGVTASVLNPKDQSTAITFGAFDGNRGAGDTTFVVDVAQAGIYPFRLLYWNTGGGENLAWFSVITNSTSTNFVLINDIATPGALKAYATATVAPPYTTAFNSNPSGFSFVVQDDLSVLVPSSLQVQLNGAAVTVTTSKVGSATTVTYLAPVLFAPGSSNVVTAQFSDNAVPPHNLSVVSTFIVPSYTALPPEIALPASAVDTAQRGLAVRVNQIDSNSSGTLAANIAHAEAQLAGVLIDPASGTPYANIAAPGPQPNGSYVITNINFSFDPNTEQGLFTTAGGYPDAAVPGLAGADDINIAGEIVAYLDLQPGFYTFAVNSTDGFRATAGANPNGAIGTTLGLFDYRASLRETRFGLSVATAGFYPVRLVWFHMGAGGGGGNAALEFYTIDTQGTKVLVNDASKPNAVKAYWKRTAGYGTFVKYAGPSAFVSPFSDSADVGFTNATVVISDGSSNQVDAASVLWTVDGTVVATTGTSAGGLTKVTYNPTGLQLPRTVHTASLAWTDAGASGVRHTNTWNFHLLRNYVLPAPLFFENFESTAAGPVDPSVPTGWTQVNFTGVQTPGNDPSDLSSDFYLGWAVVDKNWGYTGKDNGVSGFVPQILNGVAFDEDTNPLLANNYIRAETDSRQNGPPGQIQYLYTKPYDLTGKSGIVIAFNSSYEQNQDNINALEYSVDGTNYSPISYWLQGNGSDGDIFRDGLGNIDVTKTMTTSYGDVARYTDTTSGLLVGGYYGFFIKAPITQALAPYIEGRYNDDSTESKRIELYRVPLADNQKSVVFRFAQAGTSSWYWAFDNWGVYSIPSLANPPGTVSVSHAANGQLTISWTGGGTLESATDISGSWTPVPNASNPMTITPSGNRAFYRLKQ